MVRGVFTKDLLIEVSHFESNRDAGTHGNGEGLEDVEYVDVKARALFDYEATNDTELVRSILFCASVPRLLIFSPVHRALKPATSSLCRSKMSLAGALRLAI